ncbi:MAG: hypothetical protein WC297_03605 [Candidatus Paceibacterota bacterium]|jgi:hypothetical protein
MNLESISRLLDLLSQKIPEIVQEHWLKAVSTALVSGALFLFYRIRAHFQYNRHRTDNTITCSNNEITPIETSADEEQPMNRKKYKLRFYTSDDGAVPKFISVSEAAQDKFRQANSKTTVEIPLIDMSRLDAVVNDVMNTISSGYKEGIAAREHRLPVHEINWVIIFSCERFPRSDQHWDEMWEKPRVLIIEKDDLLNTCFEHEDDFDLDKGHHVWRVRTLRQAKADFTSVKPKSCFRMTIFLRKFPGE